MARGFASAEGGEAMSLADVLEDAASALPGDADAIRPANGDPFQLIELLGPDAGQRVLSWLLANEPEGGTELAFAWLEVEGGAEVLTALEEGELPKAGRKALRKALHCLRSKGVEVPSGAAATPLVARLPRIEDSFEVGYVSALDPRGARLVYLVEPNPSGGARLFEILLDENRGVVDFQVYSAGRSRIRRFVREAVDQSRFPVAEASPNALRALVARIAARHPSDRALPAAFSEWRSKLAIPGETPGDEAAASLPLDADGDGLARAVELAEEGSLGPWGSSPTEWAEDVESQIQIEAEKEPGREDWSGLAKEIFSGEQSQLSAERFRESAYVLWKRGREDDARACLAAAEAFGTEKQGHPVALAMTQVLLSPVVEGIRTRSASAEGEE